MENKKSNTQDRELLITRQLDAPIDLVWEAWTSPEHIANWWGPNGFTNTITKMDLRPGGEWDLVMHG
ncbi:MAG TPA: SRPBCC domain-containing protein, partial [Puia sp.]|nr:SRPBCC domain-containing protein [Puia sp.]